MRCKHLIQPVIGSIPAVDGDIVANVVFMAFIGKDMLAKLGTVDKVEYGKGNPKLGLIGADYFFGEPVLFFELGKLSV